MNYLLDSANAEIIESMVDCYPIAGVTTNPSIVAREDKPFDSLIRNIRRIIGSQRMLHIQTSCDVPESIIQEAMALQKLAGEPFYAKVPVTPAGIQAMMQLKKRGVGITATAVFTQPQALIAARAGVDFVALYVNRLDNIASNGTAIVSDIVHLFKMHDLPTRVLAASFKNVEQVHLVSMAGAHYATIAPDLFKHLVYHPLTEMSVAEFKKDGPVCPRWSVDIETS